MNLPKLSEAKLHNLAKQENNASVRAGNPRSFSRKSNSEIVRLAGETTASPKTIVLGRMNPEPEMYSVPLSRKKFAGLRSK